MSLKLSWHTLCGTSNNREMDLFSYPALETLSSIQESLAFHLNEIQMKQPNTFYKSARSMLFCSNNVGLDV